MIISDMQCRNCIHSYVDDPTKPALIDCRLERASIPRSPAYWCSFGEWMCKHPSGYKLLTRRDCYNIDDKYVAEYEVIGARNSSGCVY